MKISPLYQSTKVYDDNHEWSPSSFESFISELKNIKIHCRNIDHLALFRGHREKKWLLDSTFVRYVKENILDVNPVERIKKEFRFSIEFQRLMGGLFLYKFGTRTVPHKDLFDLADKNGIDPWFEWMKRIQQYPMEDLGTLRGSFLIDWTQNEEIAIFFANESRDCEMEGSVWIADITAMGNVLHQDIIVEEILEKFQNAIHSDIPLGLPLVFYPRKQIKCERANNQNAVYIAQMDLRSDLAEIWKMKEIELNDGEIIFIKLNLPKDTVKQCDEWLMDKKITKYFIYPDR
ncbi:MAG TPA: hypothetical protein VEF33_01570 [Syntrophales bacterium]|nr:hypothetical protein [Syntrophales bacterium]